MELFENVDSRNYYNKFKLLEDSYEQIVNEIPPLDINKVTISRKMNEWINKDNMEAGQILLSKLNNNKEWIFSWDVNNKMFNFPLIYNDIVIGIADILCPTTINLLKKIGGIRIAGFSLLLPGASLNPHCDGTGPTYNSMALNMCLTGDKSSLYIRNKDNIYEKYIHTNGKLVIFNSEIEHYANNNGDINRVILYIDFSF